MRVALITPIADLDYTKRGDLDMVLTHLVFKDKKYAEHYADSGLFKILDNGAFEGELNNIEKVVEAAKLVKADEIILPDIIYDSQATIAEMSKAIKWLKAKGMFSEFRLMAVPQGKTAEEWWECFKVMNEEPDVNTIGLSKLSCPKCFGDTISMSRLEATRMIEREQLVNKDKEYHLLGGSAQILHEVRSQPKWIRSIDSSAPFEYGKRRVLLSNIKKALSEPVDFYNAIKPWNKSYVKSNIAMLMEAAHGS